MEANQVTALAPDYAPYTEDWATDATTTMGETPRYALNARTTEPVRHEAARLHAVCIPGDETRVVAWAQIRELHDVHFTLRYDLEIAPADESFLLGETERVASVRPAEHGVPLVFVYGRWTERDREPRTALGKRLLEIRRRIVATGTPLLDWDDLECEVRSRRGGVDAEDTA